MDFATWLCSAEFALWQEPKPDVVVTLTTPPLLSVLGARYAKRVGAKLVPWMMDLNPDEAVAAGWLRAGSPTERFLRWQLEKSLKQSAGIIALDRFMSDRIAAKGISKEKIHLIAPWAHEGQVRLDAEGSKAFRQRQGLDGKFVVMYSGNHSPCHPLDTVVGAARSLKNEDGIRFVFVGGGTGWKKIRQTQARENLANILCLPYVPLEQVGSSLGAADLNVVAMGDPFVGLVHPCKVYNLLTLGLPWVGIGPQKSHLQDLLRELGAESGCVGLRHGDVAGLVGLIVERRRNPVAHAEKMKKMSERFHEKVLAPKLANIVVLNAEDAVEV